LYGGLAQSYLAILVPILNTVELIIGIAMIGQTKRDAQIIRHILKLEKQEIEHLEDIIENKDK
jgi:hypothetical protein